MGGKIMEMQLPSAISPPNSHGPMPEKSYFDCKVNSVRPRNTPNVITLEWPIRTKSIRCRSWTHKACKIATLSKNAMTTPSVNDSRTVNVDRRMRFVGWLWRFQYKKPKFTSVRSIGT